MPQPNIILIVSDQHRGDFMGCAGNRVVQTPNLDHMAKRGVHFTQHYCNSPLCVPSRMSMITGRLPYKTEVFGNQDFLSSDMPTFAHALSLGGYDTVLCGRMHFVGPDQRHGYQQRLVGDITPSYPGGPKTAYGRLNRTPDSDAISIHLAGPGDSPVIQYDEAVTSACETFLDERTKTENNRPLFLTVGLYGPHNPYTCLSEYYDQAIQAIEKGEDKMILPDLEPHQWIEEIIRTSGLHAVTEEQMKMARANYIGLVHQLDGYIGRILQAAHALSEDTIVVYISDHGEMAGDHGLFWKRCFYEGAAKVPMIWYPIAKHSDINIAQGRKVHALTSLVDLAPTLTRLSGSPDLPRMDGHDLTRLLNRQTGDNTVQWKERTVLSELVFTDKSPARMIRYQEYKLVYYHEHKQIQLFNLIEDPDEQHDISQLEAYQSIKDELLNKVLENWDIESLVKQRLLKMHDLNYMELWGKKVGMGRLDLWKHSEFPMSVKSL